MNKSIKYGAFLFILLAILGALLVLVNDITAPIIEERRLAKIKETIKEILPNIESFTEETGNIKNLPNEITNVYLTSDKKTAIYVTATLGYDNGTIRTLIAFNVEDNTIINYKVTEADKQTEGYGSEAKTYDFKFAGKTAETFAKMDVEKVDKTNQDLVISGATRTSKAVLNGVNIASQNFLEVYGG